MDESSSEAGSLAERLGRLPALDPKTLHDELQQLRIVLQCASLSPLDSAARKEVIDCRPLLNNLLAGRLHLQEKKEEPTGWSSDVQANRAKRLADVVREDSSANSDDDKETASKLQEKRDCELPAERLACLVAVLHVCLELPPKEAKDGNIEETESDEVTDADADADLSTQSVDQWWVLATRSFHDPLSQELGVAALDVGWNDPVRRLTVGTKVNALQRTATILRDADPPAGLAAAALSFMSTLHSSLFSVDDDSDEDDSSDDEDASAPDAPAHTQELILSLFAQCVGHTDARVREAALKPDVASKLSFDSAAVDTSALFVALLSAVADRQLSAAARYTALRAARRLNRCADAQLNADLLRGAVELVLSSSGDTDALFLVKEVAMAVLPAQFARALLASYERALEALRSNPDADVGSLLSPDPWGVLREEVALLQQIGDDIDLERCRNNDYYGRDDGLRRLCLWRKSQGARELVCDAMTFFHRNQLAKLLLQMLEVVSGGNAATSAALSAIVKQLRALTCDDPDRGEPLSLLVRRQQHFKSREERHASYIVARGRTIDEYLNLNRKRKWRFSNGVDGEENDAKEGSDDEDSAEQEAQDDDEMARERIDVKMSYISSVKKVGTAETQDDRETNLAIANALFRLCDVAHATIVPDICVILLNVALVDPRDPEEGFDMRSQLQNVSWTLNNEPGNRAVEEAFAASALLNAINFIGGDSAYSTCYRINTLWTTYPDSAVVKLHCLMAIRESFPYRIPQIAVPREEIAKAIEAFPDSCGIQSCGKLLLVLYDGKVVISNAIYHQEFDGYNPAWLEVGEKWRLVLVEDPQEADWESTYDVDGYAS
eukprot:TRINITY_DN275_c0_g5_i1.p1 TRINITY_DN275_c0_g5~~TRINITY_DN275_c0_g5_i1.p1  ORF type:complete len:839 (+),score=212.81 TRINITY_DN275_c0_g5_i1:997-3513(+)